MTKTEPNVKPTDRFELREAAEVMEVDKSTILRWTNKGLLSCRIRRSNNRRFWTGAELVRFWRACM